MKTGLQKGFSLISAIFLLVVIASLGMFAVTLSSTQHQSQALDVMGVRGYQAARAGIEWAAYQVSQSPSNAASSAPCATTLGVLGGSLSPFSVSVTCSAAPYLEGAINFWIYDVSAVASAGTGSNYVERVISVKMGR